MRLKNKNSECLIIGKMPPPIGGVTIHVKRLINKLDTLDFAYTFLSLNNRNLLKIFASIYKHNSFHLHSSNVYVQFIVSFYSKLSKKSSVFTYHGDLNRYKGIKNKILLQSVKLCSFPIVLNDESYKIALGYNKNTLQISSFIPPSIKEPLLMDTADKIYMLKKGFKKVFCTNAFNISYDKNGEEIYGIIDLISFFKTNNKYALIISDPSGAYYQYILENDIETGKNVIILNFPHSFCEVLKLSDASIRNTSTDGDSLSIKESLYFNKLTFATNVVSRNSKVIVYERGKYDVFLKDFSAPDVDIKEIDGSIELYNLYNRINK